MKIISSTQLKGQLKQSIEEILETEEEIGIDRGGVIARLTLKKPIGGYSPTNIKTEAARVGWSPMLRAVTNNDARYYFKFKDKPRVYLIREPNYEEPWLNEWRKHTREERSQRNQSKREDVMEEMREHLTRIDVVVRHLFEKMKQWETPPPHLTADDLERIERD